MARVMPTPEGMPFALAACGFNNTYNRGRFASVPPSPLACSRRDLRSEGAGQPPRTLQVLPVGTVQRLPGAHQTVPADGQPARILQLVCAPAGEGAGRSGVGVNI